MNGMDRSHDASPEKGAAPQPAAAEGQPLPAASSSTGLERPGGAQPPRAANLAAFMEGGPQTASAVGLTIPAVFDKDWTFEINRDKVDRDIIRVLGCQTDYAYFEVNGQGRNREAWGEAEKIREELQALKLPSFTYEKALEVETSFSVKTHYPWDEPGATEESHEAGERYTIEGYQTKFVFLETRDENEARNARDDFADSKLKESEKTLQVQLVKPLGEFPVTGSYLGAADPVCGFDGPTVEAQRGTWKGFSVRQNEGDWGSRNAVLLAVKSDYIPSPEDQWEEFGMVGVDGGMAALYDEERSSRHSEDEDRWNDGPCLEIGVMCQSGYGDGGYAAYAIKRDGAAVAAGIVFLAPLERYEKVFLQEALRAALADQTPKQELQ